jgi:hypothetical protein
MLLCQAIGETQSCSESFGGSFEVLTEHLSPEWVEASLSLSSHATIRRLLELPPCRCQHQHVVHKPHVEQPELFHRGIECSVDKSSRSK